VPMRNDRAVLREFARGVRDMTEAAVRRDVAP
jgi:hypothetical protein